MPNQRNRQAHGSSAPRYRSLPLRAAGNRREPLIIHTSHIQDVVLSEESRQQCLQSNINNSLRQTIQLYIARHDHTRRSQAELPEGMR